MKTLPSIRLCAALALLAACGSAKDPSAADPSADVASEGASDCSDWCEVRESKETHDGWCPIDAPDTGSGSCVQACEEWLESKPAYAVRHCVEEAPLCFRSIEQCIDRQVRHTDCTEWCEYRADEHENDGFCDPFLQDFPDADCTSVCIHGLAGGLPNVESCIKDNPMCFVDLAGCSGS